MSAAQQSKSASATKTTNLKPSPYKDEYWTPPQRIWSDVIQHERKLEKVWKQTWYAVLSDNDYKSGWRPKKTTFGRNPDFELSFYNPNPSASIPQTASGVVGWRSSDLSNSLEYFNVRYKSNKIRFEKEQQGYYRALKYLQENTNANSKDASNRSNNDVKKLKYHPKRLLS